MKLTSKSEILTLLKGATFLASGGGGPFFLAKEIVEDYFKDEKSFEINIVNSTSISKSDWCCVAAGMAQPSAGSSLTPEQIVQPTVNAVNAMENLITDLIAKKDEDRFKNFTTFKFLLPIEVGAINVTIPLISAYLKRETDVIDGDPSGRSVPTIDLTTFAVTQPIMPNMATSDGKDFEFTVLSLTDYKALGIAYSKLIQAGLIGTDTGLCLSPMNGDTLNDGNLVPGTLKDAYNIGQIFEKNISSILKIDQIKNYLANEAQSSRKMKHLCTGKVIDYFTQTYNDNDLGYLKVKTLDERIFTVIIQNENMFAQFDDETEILVTGPDSICYISTKDGAFNENDIYDNVLISQKLANNEDVNIHVVAIEASQIILDNKKLLKAWKSSYEISNYFGCYNSKL